MFTKQNVYKAEIKFRNNPSFVMQNHSQNNSQDKISFVSQILSDCYKNKCTGTLTLKNNGIIKSIHFSSGNIVFATSNLPKEQFSEFLVNSGAVSYQQLKIANGFVPQYQLHLGQVLIKLGYLDENKLKSLTTTLVSNIIWSTLTWQSSESIFQEHQQLNHELEISIPTLQLLYEGILHIENLAFLRQMIGDLDTPLYLNETPNRIYQLLNLQNEEGFILSCLDSTPYTTQALIEMGSIPELIVLRTVCALFEIGFLRSLTLNKKPSPLTSNNRTNDSRFLDTGSIMKFCQEIDLKMKELNSCVTVYKLFEVDDNASLEQLQDSYQRLARKFHPTRQTQLDDYQLDFSFDLEYIFQNLTYSMNSFINSEKKASDYPKEKAKVNCFGNIAYPFEQKINCVSSERNTFENSQIAVRQLCYEIETKSNAIKDGATLYQILGVERDSSQQAINAAFGHLSKQFAPERQTELSTYGLDLKSQLQQITIQLNKAFRILSNPTEKQEYNNQIGMNFISRVAKDDVVGSVQLPIRAIIHEQVTVAPPAQITKTIPITDSETKNVTSPSISQNNSSNTESHTLNNNDSLKYDSAKSPLKGSSKTPTASMLYLQSMQLYAKEDYEKTITALRKALVLSPNNAEYWAELGRVYGKLPNCSPAIVESAYKEAMRCNPQDSDYPTELGLVYQKYEDYIKAAEWFEKALAINPKQTIAKQALESIQKPNNKRQTGQLNSFLAKLGFGR